MVDWNQPFSHCTEVNGMFNAFFSKVTKLVHNHAPIKQLSSREVKSLAKPWITPAIRVSINIKNKHYNKYQDKICDKLLKV